MIGINQSIDDTSSLRPIRISFRIEIAIYCWKDDICLR